MPAPLVANPRWLTGFRRPYLADAAIAAELLGLCSELRTIGAALSATGCEAEARPVLMHLLWTGQLCCGLDELLSAGTVVTAAARRA